MTHVSATENCLSVENAKRSSFRLPHRPFRMPIMCSDSTRNRASW
ncbi:hypothetical protein I4F81_006252 [Pyropia yezoensis]|uniref:Uncharacterized protein n=1 Tax=Pyropia yezoensis TaxID=2788 RepID=A0ACC3C1G3_PYRYE|nr:hypothetical protein I4F81_006252 [Neopyropia yezoensis]